MRPVDARPAERRFARPEAGFFGGGGGGGGGNDERQDWLN
jgi:hypothetical protein